ncbi:hypothetical protein EV359DRAFT_68884 [Lentinula novae-zelandiae]|nr:hypothetical protein EV359DRAFT_68884 [Lentinula novae-zelandiae]
MLKVREFYADGLGDENVLEVVGVDTIFADGCQDVDVPVLEQVRRRIRSIFDEARIQEMLAHISWVLENVVVVVVITTRKENEFGIGSTRQREMQMEEVRCLEGVRWLDSQEASEEKMGKVVSDDKALSAVPGSAECKVEKETCAQFQKKAVPETAGGMIVDTQSAAEAELERTASNIRDNRIAAPANSLIAVIQVTIALFSKLLSTDSESDRQNSGFNLKFVGLGTRLSGAYCCTAWEVDAQLGKAGISDRLIMADLSLSVAQLQALHTLLLLQGSNLPDDLKSLHASLQAQLGLNSSAPSFPTPSPSPERLPRTSSISLARARLRSPWLLSQPRTTCEVAIQVEDSGWAPESFSRPPSPASTSGYRAGSELEGEDQDQQDDADSYSQDTGTNPHVYTNANPHPHTNADTQDNADAQDDDEASAHDYNDAEAHDTQHYAQDAHDPGDRTHNYGQDSLTQEALAEAINQGNTKDSALLANPFYYEVDGGADDEAQEDPLLAYENTFPSDQRASEYCEDSKDPDSLLEALLDELLNDRDLDTRQARDSARDSDDKENAIFLSDLDPSVLSLSEEEQRESAGSHTDPVSSHFAMAHEDPASRKPDCNRNGASALRKRLRVHHRTSLAFGEEQGELGEEEENNGQQFLYEASVHPRAPPKEVTDASLGCSRAEKIDTGATFVRMIYELFLAAKVNSILHKNSKDGAPLSSAYPAITSIVRAGITHNNMHNWLNAGSCWGRLASASSIYLLLVIAGQPGLASKLRSKAVSSTVLFALCNDLRWPDNPYPHVIFSYYSKTEKHSQNSSLPEPSNK